jgi:hypothetical protein
MNCVLRESPYDLARPSHFPGPEPISFDSKE